MSWLVDLRRFAEPDRTRIGPGRLVLVAGPSGAGKDTLIEGTRLACAGDPTVVFPRRIVTRPPSQSEDNAQVQLEAFDKMAADGAFALWWDAHGHRYGIPASIDDEIRRDRVVVCNVSRTAIGAARRRYTSVSAVLVTAPADVLEARLANRARSSDGALSGRMARSPMPGQDIAADVVIRNTGRPEVGIRRLLNVIRETRYFFVS